MFKLNLAIIFTEYGCPWELGLVFGKIGAVDDVDLFVCSGVVFYRDGILPETNDRSKQKE